MKREERLVLKMFFFLSIWEFHEKKKSCGAHPAEKIDVR